MKPISHCYFLFQCNFDGNSPYNPFVVGGGVADFRERGNSALQHFFFKPYQIEYHFSTSLFLKTQPPFFRLQNPKGNEQNICNALHVVAVWVLKAKATSRRRETTLRFFLIGIY